MIDLIATYPTGEGVLQMSVSGAPAVFVSAAADVELELKNGFDNQRHKARNFGRVKFLGIDLAKASVEFVVMPDEEADFWREVVPLFRQKGKRGNAPPIDVLNPQLNRAGIKTVTVLTCKIGAPNARDGRRVQVQLQEWAPAPSEPKPSTAVKSKLDGPQIEKDLSATQIITKHS